MNIETCQFVRASRIFKDNTLAYDAFVEYGPDCSWGDNNLTMVTSSIIEDALEHQLEFSDSPDVKKQCETVIGRLGKIPRNVYIDLES